MKMEKIKDLLVSTELNREVKLNGWVRSARGNKYVQFIHVNDGSTIKNIQAVADVAKFPEELMKRITTGSCISVIGTLVASQGKGQAQEVQASSIEILGDCDPETYPVQRRGKDEKDKKVQTLPLEFLREIAHLRPRTNTFGAVLRIRHAMTFAIHKFFNDKGFYNLHTPIITASDAEGAGEMFRVTTLDLNNLPRTEEGKINFEEDFFGRETNLTVSGQLEGETAALALGNIYTFGPTFRAENSNTPRHLAEFWMIEPEMAFYDINDNMDLAEEMLKFLVNYALHHCKDDVQFLNDTYDPALTARLHSVIEHPFTRISYTHGVDILKEATVKFEYKPDWGKDLQKEHENYLVEHFGGPVIVTGYPKDIKSFYMKLNDDGKTVRAMDILFPWIGEIIGGSQREDDHDKLLKRVQEMHIPQESIWWYLETRKFGSCPHSGFGLGFERLLLFVTGMTNIRDVIPFPRTPKNAEF
ncbi:MAG TPA: asparagine--tRNA ligase [Bacteroidia bacterium]|jgi:asparaginyl-tRNA synthetase|nr:asparagine--tRNA ligase [Bacteroidia bacterium]